MLHTNTGYPKLKKDKKKMIMIIYNTFNKSDLPTPVCSQHALKKLFGPFMQGNTISSIVGGQN
jgi:hypothetical protein